MPGGYLPLEDDRDRDLGLALAPALPLSPLFDFSRPGDLLRLLLRFRELVGDDGDGAPVL
jgi:hypothetical protein